MATDATGGGGGGMSAADDNICRRAIDNLMGKSNANNNYLFLKPVDLVQLPMYADVIKRPMDLGTVKSNVEAGNVYSTRDQFWADVDLVFENACVFNAPCKENAWIIKMAKAMQKAVEREKKKADKKASGAGSGAGIISGATQKKRRGRPPKNADDGAKAKPAVKLKLSAPKAVAAAIDASQASMASAAASTSAADASGSSATTGKGKKETAVKAKSSKPKPKLSLKLSFGDRDGKTKAPATSAGSMGRSSRGKALPTDVDPAEKPTKTGPKVAKPKLKLSISESGVAAAGGGGGATGAPRRGRPPGSSNKKSKAAAGSITPAQVAQCAKVLSALRHRNPRVATQWFLKPFSVPDLLDDYRAKIPFPMDFQTIGNKLEGGEYASIAEFVLDVRRIFANCLRYNTTLRDSFRPLAKDMLLFTEQALARFIAAPAPAPNGMYPPLLYCWKLCLSLLDSLLNTTNPSDGHQVAHFFLHPVSFFFGGQFPPDYLGKVEKPMDFGTITSNLFEGVYTSVSQFTTDCNLVVENCKAYYTGTADGKMFVDLADRLQGLMSYQLKSLMRYDDGSSGAREKVTPVTPLSIPPPPQAFLMSMLEDVKAIKYTDKKTKLTELATIPFRVPVNTALFPDYKQFVKEPMDVQTVETKINSGQYFTPEDFEYDINLIFRNCKLYNVPKKNTHIVNTAKHCMKTFNKEIYSKRMSAYIESGGVDFEATGNDKKRPMSPSVGGEAKAPKKIKLDLSAVPKPAPRISITARPPSGTGRARSPKPTSAPKSNEPVPLHVAIAQIKESFPLRRQAKYLEGWESACWRFFRELMKHPWLSAARPRFVFHVPVPVLFPDIREAYEERIKLPMDLTTAEAKLLSGGSYQDPEEFVGDVALVFANAITFNRDGKIEGEPMSCAYFDASKHLLKYTRWLSLEYLAEFLEDSKHTDLPPAEDKDALVTTWKLTTANRKLARDEMETIALKTPLDVSEEGDTFTFMESECEKLLKSLRHQSDAKHMYFFIKPEYPVDYGAFISKPMCWEQCSDTLNAGKYETIGELVSDLRLIFSNAFKYNGAGKHSTDTISGKAYASAMHMSTKKLEPAIDRMLLAVSNRIETDKVEQRITEREIEAEERAEEERLRKAWQEETDNAKAQGTNQSTTMTVERIKIIQRRPIRKALDFDFPFNDDDEGSQEPSHLDAMRQQKIIFESQRADRARMFKTSIAFGCDVYSRMFEQKRAMTWAKEKASNAAKLKTKSAADDLEKSTVQSSIANQDGQARSSNVGDKVDQSREQISEQLKTALSRVKRLQKKKKKRPRPSPQVFE